MNLGRIDKINKTTLSLTALDLTLGLLAIAFVSVGTATASTVSSLGSLLFILAVFKTYKSLKQGAEKIEGFELIYNKTSIVIGALDVIVGAVAIIATLLAATSAIVSASAAVSGIKFVRILNRIIQVKKLQSFARNARAIGLVGITYVILRGGNKMFKKIGKKVTDWLKYIFVTNPVTVILGIGGLALLITNGATGGEFVNYIAALVNDPTAAEALFYGVGGSAVFVAVVKQGIESFDEKADRVKKVDNKKALKTAEKRQAYIKAKAKAQLEAEKKAKEAAEAKAKLDAQERAEIERAKAELLAEGN